MVNFKEEIHGNVPLHVASSKNNIGLMQYLISRGANLNLQDIWGHTPLLYAIDNECYEAVELLLKSHAKVNHPNFRGMTPLHCAASIGNLKMVKLLLRFNADPELFDYNNKTAMEIAKSQEIAEFIKSFIIKSSSKQKAAAEIVNWIGMGIGLGIGLGISLTRQEQVREDEEKLAKEQKILEEERNQLLEKQSRIHAMQKHLPEALIGSLVSGLTNTPSNMRLKEIFPMTAKSKRTPKSSEVYFPDIRNSNDTNKYDNVNNMPESFYDEDYDQNNDRVDPLEFVRELLGKIDISSIVESNPNP